MVPFRAMVLPIGILFATLAFPKTVLSNLNGANPSTAGDGLSPLFNFTAISADSRRNSVVECWQLAKPLQSVGSFGALYTPLAFKPGAYAVFPPHADAGLHNAMTPQWIVVLAGLARIDIPSSASNATYVNSISAGPGDLVLATDMANISTRGHESTWPSGQVTSSLMIHTDIPDHKVIHRGACNKKEIA